jgi:hypothetical protein
MGHRVGNISNNVRYKRIGASELSSPTRRHFFSFALAKRERERPDGRQANRLTIRRPCFSFLTETDGALLRSKIKQGPTCSTYKKEDRRLAIFLFACGAYENIWQETIGIYFGHKLLILTQFPKNVFRGVPRD